MIQNAALESPPTAVVVHELSEHAAVGETQNGGFHGYKKADVDIQ